MAKFYSTGRLLISPHKVKGGESSYGDGEEEMIMGAWDQRADCLDVAVAVRRKDGALAFYDAERGGVVPVELIERQPEIGLEILSRLMLLMGENCSSMQDIEISVLDNSPGKKKEK